jgi:hypothetical protein
MLQSKLSFLLGDDRFEQFRLWQALVPHFMHGLPHNNAAHTLSRSSSVMLEANEVDVVKIFLKSYRFKSAKDEEGYGGSGLTPLVHAAMVGNVEVTAGLIAQGADVHSTTRKFDTTTGFDAMCTPLHFMMSYCPVRHREMVELLLRAGSHMNAPSKSGATPLMAAVVYHNAPALQALLECARDTIDLKRGIKVNSNTALGMAAYLGTPELCVMLIKAGASRTHAQDHGGTKLHDACQNVATTKPMLDLIWNDGEININTATRSATAWWSFVGVYFQIGFKSGLMRKSEFVMCLAHSAGSTPLHFAAQNGLVDVVEWLLDHGAHKSLRIRNQMGASPLDIARIFGPYPAVQTKLGSTMLNHGFDARFALRRGSLLRKQANVDDNNAPPPPPSDDIVPHSEERRASEPTMMAETTNKSMHSSEVRNDDTIENAADTRTSQTHTVPTAGGVVHVPTTSSNISSDNDLSTALTMLSSALDAQAARSEMSFDEQASLFSLLQERFDEQAARLDGADARFLSLQAQLHVQSAKLDALLDATTSATTKQT